MHRSRSTAITLRLAQLGLPLPETLSDSESAELVRPIIARQRELSRRLSDRLCAADQRIQAFLDDYLVDTGVRPHLPRRTLVLDEPGLARELSLPLGGDSFTSPLLSSYRVANGVLHNPANDRRTTVGVFHVATGGLPVPDDKIAVPKEAFARLLEHAFDPPAADRVLPYTSAEPHPAACFASLFLRPLVLPEVPGFIREKRMETRFIVPGGLVANLDFVESIFGNGGDPYLPENDASLAPETWTGHTGLVVLAPHLTQLTKKALGLPHVSRASERQRRDGMCWASDGDLYNDGRAFKACARDARGVVVTVIADTYFGYCKKEVKTQISYSANLFGNAEEEHSGGALVFPSWDLGDDFTEAFTPGGSVADVVARDPERFAVQPAGHALDRTLPDVVLVPAGARYTLRPPTVSWTDDDGGQRSVPLRLGRSYLSPGGYRVELQRDAHDASTWRLVGTSPRATSCHKPATVSGGGKSEISKAITDAVVVGAEFVADIDRDLDQVAEILARDFSERFADPERRRTDSRSILSEKRSLGSVIKLLTPSRSDYTPEYNAWLESLPHYVKELVYVVKHSYRPEWGDDWRSHFSVAEIDGRPGNRIRLAQGDKIPVSRLRMGFNPDGSWRLFSLRHDFAPAVKVQTQDDITASTVVPGEALGLDPARSYKVVENCENLLFQRPDDAIHRGYDGQAERDIAGDDVFLSNFEPLTRGDVETLRDDVVAFSAFTAPMADRLAGFADSTPDGAAPGFVVSSAHPRLVGGKPTKNPRYLQRRPDRADAGRTAVAALAARLVRGLPAGAPLTLPVDVVAAGRRNNPPEPGSPPLCSYNPLHYMELPELFMEFIASMTGKSPSTTGAGSEGALTKGPFNCLPAVIDLNAALLSSVLTGDDGWVSAAGYVGPHVRVDHDFSLLVPELFARMTPAERDARRLIEEGSLEKLEDVEHGGRVVAAGRLGYRITERFAKRYLARVFLHPESVFTAEMLRPELQDPEVFADSVDTIVATHERVAQAYQRDGTISLAVPPLRALLQIMADGASDEGWTLTTREFRAQFTRESVLASDWYADRLDARQASAAARAETGLSAIRKFVATPGNAEPTERLGMPERVDAADREARRIASAEYRTALVGTVGNTPLT